MAAATLQFAMNTEEINGMKGKGNFKPDHPDQLPQAIAACERSRGKTAKNSRQAFTIKANLLGAERTSVLAFPPRNNP